MTLLTTICAIWAAMEARRVLLGAVAVIAIVGLLAVLSVLGSDEEDGRVM